MFLKNEDIQLMIKMENVIGVNQLAIFGKDGEKTVECGGVIIGYDDFIHYMNLINRLFESKHDNVRKCREYNLRHKDASRIRCNMSVAKRRGKAEQYEYWRQQLENLKERGEY